MNLPLISVIIPVYNVEQYLRQCIDSVIGQTYRNLEIILIDDGSVDSCGKICDEYARSDDRIVVIHQQNRGVSAARNAGLKICRGELVAFVDSDDWIDPQMYQKMSAFMLQEELDIVFCTANVVQNGRIIEKRFCYYKDRSVVDVQTVLRKYLTDQIGSQAWMRLYRRTCIENLRFPEGRIYEDIAVLHIPFLNAQRPVGFLSEPLYNYRLNPNGISFTPVPNKAYHIFLGFVEHCRCAEKYAPDVLGKCVEKTARHAISVCNSAIRFPKTDLSDAVAEADEFIIRYYKRIMENDKIDLKWQAAFFLRRYCKTVYNVIFRIMNWIKHE